MRSFKKKETRTKVDFVETQIHADGECKSAQLLLYEVGLSRKYYFTFSLDSALWVYKWGWIFHRELFYDTCRIPA